MWLFDTIPRHDEGSPQFSEAEFLYLNHSARQDIDRIREVLEAWFARYTASSKTFATTAAVLWMSSKAL